jgi:hypothetical protein
MDPTLRRKKPQAARTRDLRVSARQAVYRVLFQFYRLVPKKYGFTYLKNTSARGKTLLKIIKPYLESGDSFLDIMCGYSPLAGPLIESGYHITGFDANPKPIEYLRKHFPKGEWHQCSYENVSSKGFSIFLLLGTYDICCDHSFQESLRTLLRLNIPRLFITDTSKGYAETPTKEKPFVDLETTFRPGPLRGYNSVIRLLMESGYRALNIDEYDAKMETGLRGISPKLPRIYAIFGLRASIKAKKARIPSHLHQFTCCPQNEE